jgi:hypothetical protein
MAGLGPCSPHNYLVSFWDWCHPLGHHLMLSASVHHEIYRLAPYWHTDYELLGAKEERAWSALIISPINAYEHHKSSFSFISLCLGWGCGHSLLQCPSWWQKAHWFFFRDSDPWGHACGEFPGAPLCLFFSLYPEWNCAFPIHQCYSKETYLFLYFSFCLLLGLLVLVDKYLSCHFQDSCLQILLIFVTFF